MSSEGSYCYSRSNPIDTRNKFVSIKVKEQNYVGEPSLAFFMRDVSKKFNKKIQRVQCREDK